MPNVLNAGNGVKQLIWTRVDENTVVLYRKNHLEPTIVRPLKELQISGDLVGALVRGDVEP